MLGKSRATTLDDARILFDLAREEMGRHVVGRQQVVERLALIDTRDQQGATSRRMTDDRNGTGSRANHG